MKVILAQRGSPQRGSAEDGRLVPRLPRALLFVRGVFAGALLGASTFVAAVGATLALLPAAVRPVPRGRIASPPPLAEPAVRREPLAG